MRRAAAALLATSALIFWCGLSPEKTLNPHQIGTHRLPVRQQFTCAGNAGQSATGTLTYAQWLESQSAARLQEISAFLE
ncbi:MAG: hypothetical protein KME26_33335 [Oscillatoria princeps RMCB-10]|jgi:hypothetical protein|nr:hypothetical protein [Oscillatoria princeps RMCB-10]